MQNNVVVELTNPGALALLEELENLQIIRVIKEDAKPVKLSEKYRGIFSKEDAASFDAHVKAIREEWDDI